MFSGSMDRIEDQLKDRPTCHGFVRFFSINDKINEALLRFLQRRKGPAPKKSADIFLFGKHTIGNRRLNDDKGYFYHHFTCRKDLEKSSMFSYVKKYAEERRKHIIVYNHSDGTDTLIGKWRKLPPCHLKQMADFEKSIGEKECACVS